MKGKGKGKLEKSIDKDELILCKVRLCVDFTTTFFCDLKIWLTYETVFVLIKQVINSRTKCLLERTSKSIEVPNTMWPFQQK